MISKNIHKLLSKNIQLTNKSLKNYQPLYKFCVDRSLQERFQMIRNHTTLSEYPGLNPITRQHTKNQVRIVNDEETGLRFLIETGGFTGCSDMGIGLKLGTQDQTPENAGSLQSLKSFVHIKPSFEQMVKNYQILSQTGSQFDLNYDAMSTYAKCSFLEEDKLLMVDLLLDLVIQQKQLFEDNQVTEIDLSNINELVRRAAFGDQGLGMPGKGIGNTLTNQQFLKFQQKITPHNMIISISNIDNSDEFISIIKEKIKTKYPKFLQRRLQPTPKSKYVGGLRIYETHNEAFEFAIAFPSAHSKSQHMELFNILRVLLGTASSFSSGGPGKGMHSRCTQYLLNQVPSVDKASYINEHFDDYGLFGLTVGGPGKSWEQLTGCCLHQFAKLTQPIPQQQLDRAKHILISSIYQNIERRSDRLQELTKHIFYYNRVKIYEFEHNIRKVTAKQIQNVIRELLKQKPTFVYSVNEAKLKQKLPSEGQLNLILRRLIENINSYK